MWHEEFVECKEEDTEIEDEDIHIKDHERDNSIQRDWSVANYYLSFSSHFGKP